MTIGRVGLFATGLLTLAVVVLAGISYVQLSEIRQLRDELASMRLAAEVESEAMRGEFSSLRADLAKLDASGELAEIKQSIARLRLQRLGVVMDEPVAGLQSPQIARRGLSVSNMPSFQPQPDWWWEMYPETVRTITCSDYGAEWPFETDEAILGCHGGDVIAVVYGGDFMVDSVSPGLHFFLSDISDISVFDPSSPELATAREQMIEEAQGLCHGKIVR